MLATLAESVGESVHPALTLCLIGDFSVEPPAFAPNGRKARAILARLVLARGPITRDRLSSLLWSRRADAQAYASLRQCLMELRPWTRATPPLIKADREMVELDQAWVADDISLLLDACAADDTDSILRWLPAGDVEILADLDGVDEAFDEWLAAERPRLREMIGREVLAMAERRLEAGAWAESLAVADQMTRFDPYSEHAARLVMRLRWLLGDNDGVRYAWQRIEEAVTRGLDEQVSHDTASLYRDLIARERPVPIDSPVAGGAALSASRPDRRGWPRAFMIITLFFALVFISADAPLSTMGFPQTATQVVRIEPVSSPNSGSAERQFADALAGDFVRLARASGGMIRVLDNDAKSPADFIVRIALERSGGLIISESRIVDGRHDSILSSTRVSGAASNIAQLRERTAVMVAGLIDCAIRLNGKQVALATNADRRMLIFAVCDAERRNNNRQAIALLEQLVRRWPDDPMAMGKLALVQAKHIFDFENADDQERQRRLSIQQAQRAIAVEPDNLFAFVALSQTGPGELYMVDGLPMLEKALAIEPQYPNALGMMASGLFQAGYVEASVAPSVEAANIDPTSIARALAVVRRRAASGKRQEAEASLAAATATWPDHPDLVEHEYRLAIEFADTNRAASLLRTAAAAARSSLDVLMLEQIADGARDSQRLEQVAEYEFAAFPPVAYQLAAYYTRLGDIGRALSWLDRAPVRQTSGQWSVLFWQSASPLRRDPRFFRKMARLGLVDYWLRQKRWPDFCFEPGLSYSCQVEAARLSRLGRAVSAGNGASL